MPKGEIVNGETKFMRLCRNSVIMRGDIELAMGARVQQICSRLYEYMKSVTLVVSVLAATFNARFCVQHRQHHLRRGSLYDLDISQELSVSGPQFSPVVKPVGQEVNLDSVITDLPSD